MRRVALIISGLLILLAICIPAGLFYYIAFTESGLQFVINRIPHHFAGVQLDIVNVHGTLARGLTAERVEIDHERVHLRFEGIQGRVQLLPLLLQTIRSRDAVVRSAYIEVRRRTKPSEPFTPFFLPRWLIISADHTRVGSAVLVVPGGNRLEATDLLGSAILRHHTIRFFEANMRMGEVGFAAIGELRAADPLRIDAEGRIVWTPQGQPQWVLDTTAHGDLDSLAVSAHVTAPFTADFTGRALDLTNAWHLQGETHVQQFDLAAWNLRGPLGTLRGQLAVKGDASGFSARGPVTSDGLNAGIFDVVFEGAYADRVLSARHIDVVHRQSGAHAVANGTIGIVPNGPRLDLRGNAHELRWPLVGKQPALRSASGDFEIAGMLPYDVHASGTAAVAELEAMPVEFSGKLGADRFTFSNARVEAFDGHALLEGAVVWTPRPGWSVQGTVNGFNPGKIRPDLPGTLDFGVTVQGHDFSEAGDFELEVRNLGGKLRGVTAIGGGRLARTGRTWQFQGVRVALGRTSLALDGNIANELDLRFAIRSEDLSLLAEGSRGQLQATGAISGRLSEPTISASARGADIHHHGIDVGSFDAQIDFDPQGHHPSNVAAHVRNLVYEQRKFETLNVSLEGPPASFAVRLEAKTPGLAVSAQGMGPYQHGTWQGELQTLNVEGSQSLHLELERPTGLQLSAEHVRADWMCLVGTPASVCADAEWTPARWATTFTTNELPLGTLTSGLTPSVEYSGRVNALVRLLGTPADPVQGTVRLDLTDAQLAHRLSSGRIEHTTLGSGQILVNATRTELEAEVGLDAGTVGTIKGALTAQRTGETWQAFPVQGELHAHTGDLGLITLYLPQIDRAAGTLNADVSLSGTLGSPLLNGMVKVTDGEIDFYQVNLRLRQVGLEAQLTDRGIEFSTSAGAGLGAVTAHGRMEWRDSLPYGRFQLEGTNLRVVDVPEAQIDASPNLQFDINGRRIEVTGAVKVPYAKIVPVDLKGAVRPSSDEVIVGREQTDPKKRAEIMSTITLSLGDRVSIDTAGLSGRLTGNITVRSGYDELTRATGELSIEDGRYVAYARKLDIQRGRLIFTGGPIEDPGVDLRAAKVFNDVTAGVNVRGTLRQPHMSFFSEPSLPQSQIVSLILAGGGMETVQNPKSGAGNEALAQGGAILAQQLGSRLGLEDISLEQDLSNETSLVLGKYFSPRLYVSFGVSLTQQLNTLKVRYSLGDHWTMRTEVGQARGADLVFTIDK
jgi:translocation and assembly module TamB